MELKKISKLTQLAVTLKNLTVNFWTALVLTIALIISIPIFFVLSSIFANSGDAWAHLASTVFTYIFN